MCLAAVDWLQSLGPFAAAGGFALAAIIYLRQELANSQERLTRMADDRLELAKQSLPVLERAVEAVRTSTSVIERHSSTLGEAAATLQECRRSLERAAWVLEHYDSPRQEPSS